MMGSETEKIIGIVGGAGPFAGLDLLAKILDQTIADKDQDHLTVINLSQPNRLPDRTKYLLGGTTVNPAHAIFNQIQQLDQAGAKIAAIPCNTAHASPILDVVKTQIHAAGCQIKFLNMIIETIEHIRLFHPHIQRIGVLSTTGTYQAKIYATLFEPEGFTVVVPTLSLQTSLIHPAIYDPDYGIKAQGKATERAKTNLLQGVDALRKQGAEAIILGCTEIPLAITERQLGELTMVDPTLILARALIRESSPEKLRPWV